MPIAGLQGPIDLEDMVFALNNAQATGVAWVAPPPLMNVDTPDLSADLSPSSVYDDSSATEDDSPAPVIEQPEVYDDTDESAVESASRPLTWEDVFTAAQTPELDALDRALAALGRSF